MTSARRSRSVRFRILAILIPLQVVYVLTAGKMLSASWENRQTAYGLNQAVDFVLAASKVIHETQKERGKTALFLNGVTGLEEVTPQRAAVDSALEAFAKETAKSGFLDKSTLARIEEVRASMPTTRKDVDAKAIAAPESTARYSKMMDSLIAAQSDASRIFKFHGIEGLLLSLTVFESAKENMGRLRANLNTVFAQDKPVPDEKLSMYEGFRAGVKTNLRSPALVITPEAQGLIEKLFKSESWTFVETSYATLVSKAKEGGYGVDAKRFGKEITQSIDDLYVALAAQAKSVDEFAKEGGSSANREFVFLFSICLFVTISAMVAGWRTVRSIAGGLSGIADRLSEGADLVARSAVDVSSTGSQLASSTTEQAAALQETVASLEEVNAMVAKNAENAKLSLEAANRSAASARQGSQAVGDVSEAIREIESGNKNILSQIEKSNEELTKIVALIRAIGDKTKVINDIVFQTKLLSFNASVEAARAGEHGKGFAVVAEEVGNLAQMSGNSAKEIGTLLDESLANVEQIVNDTKTKVTALVAAAASQVGEGTNRVKRCEEILGEIVSSSEQVSKLLDEISQASREQASGVSEINRAMVQMDQVTQENAAGSQKSASAGGALEVQSGTLRIQVQNLLSIVNGGEIRAVEVESHAEQKVEPKAERGAPVRSAARNVVAMKKPASPKPVPKPASEFKQASGAEFVPSSDDSRFEDV